MSTRVGERLKSPEKITKKNLLLGRLVFFSFILFIFYSSFISLIINYLRPFLCPSCGFFVFVAWGTGVVQVGSFVTSSGLFVYLPCVPRIPGVVFSAGIFVGLPIVSPMWAAAV